MGLLGHEAGGLVEPESQLLASERNPAQLMTEHVLAGPVIQVCLTYRVIHCCALDALLFGYLLVLWQREAKT